MARNAIMASNKQNFELIQIGKEHRTRLEPRILREKAGKAHHAAHRAKDRNIFETSPHPRGQPPRHQGTGAGIRREGKCIFIDPAYNIASGFETTMMTPSILCRCR
jgi:hypothetical protein